MTHRTVYVIAVAIMFAALSGATAQPAGNTLPIPNRPDVSVTSIEVNSLADDFAPVPLKGGRTLVFTSSVGGPFGTGGQQRVWSSSHTSSGWDLPRTTGQALAQGEHVGTATLTPDGNFMIVAAYEWDVEGQEGSGRTDLYQAERSGGEWINITNLGPAINSSDWDSQPAISSDGRTLYFASDRDGGLGGTDIYVSRRTAAGWAPPVNIGAPVNTPYDDMSPTIAPDGRTLFFSSLGHGGAGGFDIFAATSPDNAGTLWGKVENIGTPINSEANEYFFASIANSQNSLFSSDRRGNLDIYTAFPNPFPPEALVTVSGQVIDARNRQPVAATITVTDLSSGEVVANFRTDDRNGEYYVILTRGRRYSITAEAPDYIFYSDYYEVRPNTEGKDLRKNIELNRLGGGTTRLLVFFDFDQALLKNESKPDLNRGIAFLLAHPAIRVEIAGHTDSLGSNPYNVKLSQDRAEAVRKFIVDGGVEASRVKAKGYGEEQPIADNGTDEGRARNRRVEMRVQE